MSRQETQELSQKAQQRLDEEQRRAEEEAREAEEELSEARAEEETEFKARRSNRLKENIENIQKIH